MSERIEQEEKETRAIIILWVMALFIGLFFGSAAANAQMSSEPWGFTAQNRASIAALIRQVEDSGNGSSTATALQAGSSSFDTLVCGGDGTSAATGNSTCIILNNATGAIEIGQDALGNQDADNTESTTVSGLEEVLADLSE